MTTSETSLFGSSIKRREDPRLIIGRGTFVDDVKLAGMLRMAFVRSPYAHANIKSIDTSQAKALDGVVAVYTGEELADKLGLVPCGWVVPDTIEVPHPPMAVGKVRCIGEPVAVVVAKDAIVAEDAVALVDVDYEELPVVVNAELAMQSGQPQLHEIAPNNKCFEWEVAGGDVVQAAAEAEVTIKQRIVNQRLIPNSMEGRATIGDFNPGTNQVTLWTSSQIPHLVKLLIALVTGHPEHLIRVITPDVGGGFGCKISMYAEELITFAIAKDLGRPVKWTEERQENYMATTHGRDHIGDFQITGKRDGTITSIQGDVYANLGAYLSTFAPAIPTLLFGLVLSGPYDIPNIRCKVTGVFTNTTSVEAYRGAGRPEATFVLERLVDMFAKEIGMDPAEVRRKNLIPPFEDGHDVATGVTY
ncbi:MAG: xanthine dehydrogenase family protein molybdopterin-binding subunit, partial [Chloroflexi bacterium]|nr:xanthine dehydrogenase family protein molybdopterin-binding subunit [Chloroflexota bacterium]